MHMCVVEEGCACMRRHTDMEQNLVVYSQHFLHCCMKILRAKIYLNLMHCCGRKSLLWYHNSPKTKNASPGSQRLYTEND